MQSQQQLKDLKVIVTTSESNHRETLGIVADKSKENAYLKNEIHNLKQANDQILDQISQYDEKYRSAKNEFKKVQEETLKNQNQVITYSLINLIKTLSFNDENLLKVKSLRSRIKQLKSSSQDLRR